MTNYQLTVTDETSPYFGQILTGVIIYYDLYHTGSSPHLLAAKDAEGKSVRLLSTQIDIDDYYRQEREQEITRLGANVGDTVKILKSGSGSFVAGWSHDGFHVITRIDPSGHVTFDDGAAAIFRPTVEVVTQ
jgi:hypothetical protein